MDGIERVRQLKWFHAIDFGEFASQGRFKPGEPQNITLYGAFDFLLELDLSAADVLDIGTYDGIVAFGVKKLGARSVVAVDTHANDAFLVAREILGYEDEIEYVPGVQIAALPSVFPRARFDLIVCCGVIYHMLRPMEAFTECRKLLGKGGILILETPYDQTREEAVLVFNGIEKVVSEPYTYFVPTKRALEGMAQLSGFRILAHRILKAPRRITFLLQAVDRAELIDDEGTAEFVVQMLKRDTCDDGFRFRDLEKEDRKSPGMIGSAIEAYGEIDPRKHQVRFPFHPPLDRPAYGTTRFETASGNDKVL